MDNEAKVRSIGQYEYLVLLTEDARVMAIIQA